MVTVDPTDVAAAEAAWLRAWGSSDHEAMRALMRPDCLVLHGPVGHHSGPEEFLAYNTRVGVVSRVEASDVVTRTLGEVVVVSCLQESRIAFVAGMTPFVIQAAVTRVWVPGLAGWRLAYMQMARRQPPG